ncbi:MAG: YggT family protein [Vicinamibacterales bacterium]|nr:YggT family protein [Vicinamibacterales bacterium]MDP6607474.1 YggT family protein [Vicinamibacterales bacterium]
MLLGTLFDLYSLVVIVAVVMSWMQLPPHHPAAQFVGMLTEPVLAPIRRVLPPMGGLDLSPMVLLIGLQFLRRLLTV